MVYKIKNKTQQKIPNKRQTLVPGIDRHCKKTLTNKTNMKLKVRQK